MTGAFLSVWSFAFLTGDSADPENGMIDEPDSNTKVCLFAIRYETDILCFAKKLFFHLTDRSLNFYFRLSRCINDIIYYI